MLAPFTGIDPCGFLLDTQKPGVYQGGFVDINQGISAHSTLIVVNDLGIVAATGRFYGLYYCVLNKISENQMYDKQKNNG